MRVSKIDQSNETSVQLGRMKPYHQRSAFVDPDFEKINQTFLGAQLPMPHLEKEASQVCIGLRTVESVVDHKRWEGRSFPFNVRFRARFRANSGKFA